MTLDNPQTQNYKKEFKDGHAGISTDCLSSSCLIYDLNHKPLTSLNTLETTDLAASTLWRSTTSLQKDVTELSINWASEVHRPSGLLVSNMEDLWLSKLCALTHRALSRRFQI